MKKQKALSSSNDCKDKNCPVCLLIQKVEKEDREPTEEEIMEAMLEPT
jgi:hypothetical protein